MKEKKITYFFRNLSVFQKMIVSLSVCVIIPSIILGMLVEHESSEA